MMADLLLESHSASDLGNKTQHNLIFAAWLVQTFGQTFLRTGTGVVEVAGGLGLLSYELSVRYGIFATVIEPRKIKLSSMLRRKSRKLTKHRRLQLDLRKDTNSVCKSQDKTPLLHWLKDNAGLDIDDDGFILDSVIGSLNDNTKLPFTHICQVFSPEDQHIRDLLSRATLLVGMHPDIVTESIVDSALSFGIPFAVVPCCVFSHCFPNRVTKSGELVRSYEDFIEYLRSKDSSIQTATLPFEGRNIVLYRVPKGSC